MQKIICLAIVFSGQILLAYSALGQKIDFEDSQYYKTGADVFDLAGWKGSTKETAAIAERESDAGIVQRFVRISKSPDFEKKIVWTSNSVKSEKKNVLFLDFAIKPAADQSSEPQFSIDIGGARLAFLKTTTFEGKFVCVQAKDGSTKEVGPSFELDESGKSIGWIKATIRVDQRSGFWDLFLNGKLVTVNQPSLNDTPSFAAIFYPSSAGECFLDDLQFSHINPLFPDEDVDGIPDAVEMANGTKAYFDDRGEDPNADGVSNIESFMMDNPLSTPVKPSHQKRRFVYINNQSGDDEEAGELPYKTNQQGPKKSLRGAAKVTGADVVFVLMPSDKPYVCPNYPSGKAPDVGYILLGNATLTGE